VREHAGTIVSRQDTKLLLDALKTANPVVLEEMAAANVTLGDVQGVLRGLLDDIQTSLYRQAKAFLESHTMSGMDRATFFELCSNRSGMVDIPWCERPECEAEVKRATTATTRVLRPLDEANAICTACGEPARVRAYFAQSY